jgi:[ribosomal protein S18]-alanine N-acetyltransferase
MSRRAYHGRTHSKNSPMRATAQPHRQFKVIRAFSEVTPIELRQLAELERDSFTSYYRPHRFTLDDFRRYLRSTKTLGFVAHSGSRPIGYVLGTVNTYHGERVAVLDSVAVTPLAQGKGIGKQLASRFLDEARRRGCERVVLAVSELNSTALGMYERLGFRPFRRFRNYYRDGIPASYLRKELSRQR